MSVPPSRVDPLQASPPAEFGAELTAALQAQDERALARLSARWAHRHGVESLQRLIQKHDAHLEPVDLEPALAKLEGAEHPAMGEPAVSEPALIQPAVTGVPPTRPRSALPAISLSNPIRRLKTLVRDCIDEVASTFQDPAAASPVPPTLSPAPPTSSAAPLAAAPVPLGLAELRTWLPDSPDEHHRRAS